MPSVPWQPLLEGEPAAEARRAAEEIAAALRPEERSPGILAAGGDPGLAGGAAGLALFFAHFARAGGGERAARAAAFYRARAAELLAEVPLPPGLFGGFAGVGWVARHLSRLEGEAGDDGCGEIDAAVLRLLRRARGEEEEEEFDLVGGLAGLGVYALEGLPRPAAREMLLRLAARLEASAHRPSPGEAAWFSHHHGRYNLGLAHGTPGVVAMLAAFLAADIEAECVRSLLAAAVAWLLAQQLPEGAESRFPPWRGEGLAPIPARLAWCYGDPGVAAALLAAARAAGRDDWEREARTIALRASRRAPESAGVRDAGLCHGAAGLGHLFHRLYRATAEEPLAEAARSWFHRALDFRQPGRGVAGYLAWEADAAGRPEPRAEAGWLTGAAGIGLALLAALGPDEPGWDRPLLLGLV